jgi:predicted SAM-dependent methyltransferase
MALPRFRTRAPVRINLGCGKRKLDGFINVDRDNSRSPDVCAEASDYLHGITDETVDEVYAGHFLEHLERDDGLQILREVYRVLKPAGKVGLVVPDTHEIMRRICAGELDLDEACSYYLYSTVQPSRHRWSYDERTLARLLEEARFVVDKPIDRWNDPRLVAGVWWQCGLDAVKP